MFEVVGVSNLHIKKMTDVEPPNDFMNNVYLMFILVVDLPKTSISVEKDEDIHPPSETRSSFNVLISIRLLILFLVASTVAICIVVRKLNNQISHSKY